MKINLQVNIVLFIECHRIGRNLVSFFFFLVIKKKVMLLTLVSVSLLPVVRIPIENWMSLLVTTWWVFYDEVSPWPFSEPNPEAGLQYEDSLLSESVTIRLPCSLPSDFRNKGKRNVW